MDCCASVDIYLIDTLSFLLKSEVVMADNFFMQCLETISQYNMAPAEAVAYKLCCLYQLNAKKAFPEYFHPRMGKGDPRKTSLFKYCYKLINDTQNKLDPKEYNLYIKAQMDIFRALGGDGVGPLVQPSCLVGEKAWKRWLVWKRHYEIKKRQFNEANEVVDIHRPENVKNQLNKTKEFLELRLKGLTKENLVAAFNDRRMPLWIKTHQITPYYVLLSPLVTDWLAQENLTIDVFQLDLDYFRPGITPEIVDFFNQTMI